MNIMFYILHFTGLYGLSNLTVADGNGGKYIPPLFQFTMFDVLSCRSIYVWVDQDALFKPMIGSFFWELCIIAHHRN